MRQNAQTSVSSLAEKQCVGSLAAKTPWNLQFEARLTLFSLSLAGRFLILHDSKVKRFQVTQIRGFEVTLSKFSKDPCFININFLISFLLLPKDI